jgi:tetratricopeptide (TPR) repeat protein
VDTGRLIEHTNAAPAPSALYEAGVRHMQEGRLLEAQLCCRQALTVNPHHAESLHLMGLLALQAGQYDHAIAWIAQANAQDVGTDYLFSLGTALGQQGLPEQALKAFDRLVQLKPKHAETLASRGTILHRLRRFDEAIVDNLQAHQLNPASADICNNIGASLQLLRRDEEALTWFDKALALRPNFVMALINKASSLAQMRRLDETIAAYRQVKAIDPEDSEAQSYLALIHLLIGDFEAGWHGVKLRWKAHMRESSYPDFHQHLWLGKEDVNGKTIFVFADEGFGDTIQFARYIPMLAARGAKVVLAVEDALRSLLSRLRGVAECLPQPAPSFPPFDLHCPIGLLPLAFGTRLDNIPAAVPYVPPPPQARVQYWDGQLRERLGTHRKLRIGLIWSGNAHHINDHNRSIPLSALQPLLDADASFVSLQKEPRVGDAPLIEASGIIDLTVQLTDFADTLALMSCLDLVISVDTSTAHLAAAAGRPTWILLPYLPDYRWLLDRDDSPWYPTARLFRQSERRDWQEVADRVRAALDEQIASRSQHTTR